MAYRRKQYPVTVKIGEVIRESDRADLVMIPAFGVAAWLPHRLTEYIGGDTVLIPEWLYREIQKKKGGKHGTASSSDPGAGSGCSAEY